jgi:hypothetical protein
MATRSSLDYLIMSKGVPLRLPTRSFEVQSGRQQTWHLPQ